MEVPPDQAPTIDVDVFNLILACLPRADLLNVTLVSHFAREEVIKELLMRPVRLVGNENLHKFCQFALAGDPRRLSCLQNLTIGHIEDEGPFSFEEREMVAWVLTHCTSLRRLELRSCDELIMEDSVVSDIISALPSLAHLAVWMCRHGQKRQDDLLRMVLNMKVSLRSLHFSMLSDGLPKVKELQDVARIHRHLEELTLQLSIFTCPGVSFPAVRKLQLVLDHDIPQLRDVYRTFPNVRELSIEHYQNMDAEIVPPNDSASCWPSLVRLQVFPSIIYNLGISCPVRDLELHCYYSDAHEKFAAVVSRLRPSKLTFSLYCDLDCRWAVPRAHPSLLLHGTADAGVKHLFVKAPYSTSRPLGTHDFMVSICVCSSCERHGVRRGPYSYLTRSRAGLHTPPAAHRARRAPARSHLRALHLSVRGPGRDGRPAYQVER